MKVDRTMFVEIENELNEKFEIFARAPDSSGNRESITITLSYVGETGFACLTLQQTKTLRDHLTRMISEIEESLA